MDDDYFARRQPSSDHPLPSPSDTPYATPHPSSARISSFGSQPTSTPLTPPPLPPNLYQDDKVASDSGDHADFDPAQFTPALHASLVQQILSLRRELESKASFIDDLETNLISTRTENETLQSNLKRTGKETRALKRELQLHEDGNMSAMELLAKERDEANDANSELRRRLDLSQKRVKSQDEDGSRVKTALEQERLTWATEKRQLERRAQLAEQRLVAVVDEVAAREALSQDELRNDEQSMAGAQDDTKGDAASVRSVASPESGCLRSRASITSVQDIKHSLADELDFSDREGDIDSKRTSKHTSPIATRDVPGSTSRLPMVDRPASKASLIEASTALGQISELDFADREVSQAQPRDVHPTSNDEGRTSKVLGLVSSFENQMRSVVEEQERSNSLVARSQTTKARLLRPAIDFDMDSEDSLPDQQNVEMAQEVRKKFSDIEARQRRDGDEITKRRRSHARTKSDPLPHLKLLPLLELLNRPLSPPSSRESYMTADSVDGDAQARDVAVVASTGTQTELAEVDPPASTVAPREPAQSPPAPSRLPPPPPPSRQPPPIPGIETSHVPVIAVHPPDNASLQPRRQSIGLRNVGTQTHYKKNFSKSSGMQTEKIRVDRRRLMQVLPATFLEQARSSMEQKRSVSDPAPRPKEDNIEKDAREDEGVHSPLPPLEELEDDIVQTSSPARKSLYSSPPLLPADDPAQDPEELDELNLSDIEYGSALSVKRNRSQRHSSKSFEPPAPVPEHGRITTSALYARSRLSMSSRATARSSIDKGKKRVPSLNVEALGQYQSSRLPNLTRSASVNESRSPSLSSGFSSAYSKTSGPRPPFAIPSRKSSREQYTKIRYFRTNVSSSPTRLTAREPSPSKTFAGVDVPQPAENLQPHVLRKARSAAAINETIKPSDTLGEPAALGYTKLVRTGKQLTAPPKNVAYESKRTDKKSPTQVAHIGTMFPTGSATAFSSMQHSVVDAITATTIGEWMFKYMRKRKSFGVTEGDANNERHKRWVWLSPYDRTIMWSTKQPATNSALMGKTGRKLSIQSVLDVKDDSPTPKEARTQGVFNRSILVLTPARALKFTAVSRDRHYLWLTALSFLAQSSDRNVSKYNFQAPEASVGESVPSSGRSRASSFKNPLRSNRSKNTSERSSGLATPAAQQSEANAQRAPPTGIADTAFAPSVPRVPHSRKRSMTGPSSRGRTGGGIFSGLSSAQTSTTKLTTGNSSARVQSVGGTSQRRSLHRQEEEAPEYEARGRESTRYSRHSRLDSSPRPSLGNPDFGVNSSFFDAVGVAKLDAFVRPAGNSTSAVAAAGMNGSGVGGDKGESRSGHRRHDSSGTFIGPPDIARSRPLRRTGQLQGARQTTIFGF